MDILKRLDRLAEHAGNRQTINFNLDAGEIIAYIKAHTELMTPELYRSALKKIHVIVQLCIEGMDAERERLVSNIKEAYDCEVSKTYNFAVTSLDNKIGVRADLDTIMEASAAFFEPGEALIPSRGDGNCFPRACIQSLLIRGATTGKKEDVVQFLREIYGKHQRELTGNAICRSKITEAEFGAFIKNYLDDTLTIEELAGTYFPHYHTADNGVLQIVDPDEQYDKYCYFLAACLRYDIADFAKTIKETPDGTSYAMFAGEDGRDISAYVYMRDFQHSDIRQLQVDSDVQLALMYWPQHNVQLVTSQLEKIRNERGVDKPTRWSILEAYSTAPNDDFIRIDINQGSNHYDARVVPSIDGIAACLVLDDKLEGYEEDALLCSKPLPFYMSDGPSDDDDVGDVDPDKKHEARSGVDELTTYYKDTFAPLMKKGSGLEQSVLIEALTLLIQKVDELKGLNPEHLDRTLNNLLQETLDDEETTAQLKSLVGAARERGAIKMHLDDDEQEEDELEEDEPEEDVVGDRPGAVKLLKDTLDKYILARQEGREVPRNKYFWGGLFGWGISYKEKLDAVAALNAALDFDPAIGGDVPDLADHLPALRDGHLGGILRTFIRGSYWKPEVTAAAQFIVGQQNIEHPRVRDFIAALMAHNEKLLEDQPGNVPN